MARRYLLQVYRVLDDEKDYMNASNDWTLFRSEVFTDASLVRFVLALPISADGAREDDAKDLQHRDPNSDPCHHSNIANYCVVNSIIAILRVYRVLATVTGWAAGNGTAVLTSSASTSVSFTACPISASSDQSATFELVNYRITMRRLTYWTISIFMGYDRSYDSKIPSYRLRTTQYIG